MNLLPLIKKHATRSGLNAVFTGYCFLLPPLLGSAVSVTFNGGGIWSVFEIALRQRRFHFDRPAIVQTAALYAYCASCFLSSAVNNSFAADAPSLLSLATFLFFPFSYLTWSISEKASIARIVILSSMAACFGAFVLAIVQYHWWGMRAEGGAGNAIVFATVVCLAAMVCLAGALSGLAGARAALLIAVLAGLVAILYSGARVMWVATPVAGCALLFCYRKSFTRSPFLRLALAIVAAGAVAAIFGFHVIETRLDAALDDLADLSGSDNYDTAIGLRVALWHIGLDAFHQAPIFGHGSDAAKTMIEDGFRSQFGLARGFSHFHNGFLTALVVGGVVSAVALASIFVVAAANATRTLRTSTDPIERFGAAMIMVVVIVYLLGGMTGILVGHDILDAVLMIFLIVGTYLACGRTAEPLDVSIQASVKNGGTTSR